MRSARHALLLAALLVTAGCSGAFGGGSAGPGATETTTATTAEPNDTAAATNGQTTVTGTLAPGLTADGLADPSALVRAHADALEDRSATLRERQARRYGDGDRGWRRNRTLRTAANRTRFLSATETDDRPIAGASEGRGATFADGERVYRKVETPDSSWTDVLRTASGDPESPGSVGLDATRSEDLYVLLNAFALNDSGHVLVRADDPRRYHLESSTLARPGLLSSHLDLADVRNASLHLVVTADGRVVEYRLEYAGRERGTDVRGTTTLEYSAVGETTVEAPAWYDGAKERVEGDETTQAS